MNIESILGYGFIGFAFLLAYLAFILLKKEQAVDAPRLSILISIFTFMAFSLMLAGGGLYLQLEENQYKTQLQELSRVLDQKVNHEANNSVSPAMKSLIDQLDVLLKKAKNDGLIDGDS
jgi:hypothetical protein